MHTPVKYTYFFEIRSLPFDSGVHLFTVAKIIALHISHVPYVS